MPTQNRLELSRPLDQHGQRDASTLKAPQFVVVTAVALTTTADFPEPATKDHALIDGTAGPLKLIVPAGNEDIIGLPFSATKTDVGANAIGLQLSGSDQMADATTEVTTAAPGGTVSIYWDGSKWRHTYPIAASSGGQAGSFSSLAVGDGTGSPTAALDKSAGGTAAYDLKAVGVLRGRLSLDGSEVVKLAQHDGAGAEVGALSFNATTGAASLSKSLTIATGGLTVTAGGATITAGGATITAGGLTINGGAVKLDLASTPDAADDAAAALAGVPVGGQYRTGSALKIRAA